MHEPGSFLPDQDSDRFDREPLHLELEALGRQHYRERRSPLALGEPALPLRQVVGDSSAERSDLPL